MTPLSELEDREVLTDEIVEVKSKEDELIAKLKYCFQDVSALTGIIKGLEEQCEKHINEDKENRLKEIQYKNQQFEIMLKDLEL